MPNYNSFYPATYQNPYQGGYYQMYQQPQYQPMQQLAQQTQQVQQSVQQISNVWIYDPSEITNYPVAPNNAVRFWIANKKVFYEKSADATGKPTLKVFDYTEHKETASEDSSASSEKLSLYVTKDELSAVVNVVNGYKDIITTLTKDLETVKGDLYGIAGKKKTASKKQEEDADE